MIKSCKREGLKKESDNACRTFAPVDVTIDLSYKSADTSNNQNTGINFLWRNNSGTVEMVGVRPDDGDINISLCKPKF